MDRNTIALEIMKIAYPVVLENKVRITNDALMKEAFAMADCFIRVSKESR